MKYKKICNENFRFNHVGVAVTNLDKIINNLKDCFGIKFISNITFDPIQKVKLMLIDIKGITVELVCGEKVNRFITKQNGFNFYHLCYDVDNFDEVIDKYNDMCNFIMVSKPVPAILFNNRRIAFFFRKNVGLIEILERAKI